MPLDVPQPLSLPRLRFASEAPGSRPCDLDGARGVMRGCVLLPRPNQALWEQQREMTTARAIAALRTCPSARALTHESAALLHGLPLLNPEPDVRVAVPSLPRTGRRSLGRALYSDFRGSTWGREVSLVRSSRSLDGEDVTLIAGIPVTTLRRTIVDCAMDLPARESICVVDAGLRRLCQPDRWGGRCTADPDDERARLLDLLESLPARRGVRRARAVLSFASPWAESPGESVLRWRLAVDGVPDPVLQQVVEDREHRWFIDLAWPASRLAVEFDGYSKYGDAEDLRAEKRRELRLQALGWTVLRFDWAGIGRSEELTTRVRARLAPDEEPAPVRTYLRA